MTSAASSGTWSSGRGRSQSIDTLPQASYLEDNLLGDEPHHNYTPTVTTPEVPERVSQPVRPFTQQYTQPSRAPRNDAGFQRLVIAIDYGTTFTGVAFATPDSDIAQLDDVRVLDNWGPRMGNHLKIPTVYSYSPATNGEEQWGNDISRNAVTMVNIKPELEIQDNKIDELELTLQLLEGTGGLLFENIKRSGGNPEYSWKSPEAIITDYLTKVYECFDRIISGYGTQLRSTMPVDIVVTVPVKWSYQAKNSTIRAIREAGFNEENFNNLTDIIMVTEPEAASIYTARYLKEQKGKNFFKKGDCFVLCDAGGGTVDVIAYQVVQLEPTLELKEMTIPTMDKCGASFINRNFKRWFYRLVGSKNYRELDPPSANQRIGSNTTEGGPLRELMEKFEIRKKDFSNRSGDMKIDLPEPLHALNIQSALGRVNRGELTITANDMRDFFDPCVNRVVELIQGQIQHVEKRHRRVKNVLLVGGFGESPYLQEELRSSLLMRKISLSRPEMRTAWTAVIRGAVMCGIEKSHYDKLSRVKVATRSYGIKIDEFHALNKFDQRDVETDPLTNQAMAKGQLIWLVRKGDIILSDEPKVAEKEFSFNFRTSDDRRFSLPIYEYPDEEDDVPDRWETGQEEVNEVGVVRCDLANLPTREFTWRQNPVTGQQYHTAYLVCKMRLSLGLLHTEVFLNEARISHTQVTLDEERYEDPLDF